MRSEAWVRFFEALAENPALRAEFVQLALRYGVDFAAEGQLSEQDLEKVTGGATMGEMSQLDNLSLQDNQQQLQETTQMLSNASKMLHDTTKSIIQNIRG